MSLETPEGPNKSWMTCFGLAWFRDDAKAEMSSGGDEDVKAAHWFTKYGHAFSWEQIQSLAEDEGIETVDQFSSDPEAKK